MLGVWRTVSSNFHPNWPDGVFHGAPLVTGFPRRSYPERERKREREREKICLSLSSNFFARYGTLTILAQLFFPGSATLLKRHSHHSPPRVPRPSRAYIKNECLLPTWSLAASRQWSFAHERLVIKQVSSWTGYSDNSIPLLFFSSFLSVSLSLSLFLPRRFGCLPRVNGFPRQHYCKRRNERVTDKNIDSNLIRGKVTLGRAENRETLLPPVFRLPLIRRPLSPEPPRDSHECKRFTIHSESYRLWKLADHCAGVN